MKRSAAVMKNIAALIMLFALLSLLLPFCKINTSNKSTTISGIEVIKISAKTGYEYYSKGSIANSYVIKDKLTWGDLKAGTDFAQANNELWKIEAGLAVILLPVLLCFLAMLFTFLARGKKTMILPTLFITLALVENILIIIGFPKIQKLILSYIRGEGVNVDASSKFVTLLIGIFAFTFLCAIAFAIIMLLWFTGAFNKPRRRDGERDYYEDDDNRDKRKDRRDRSSDDKDRKKKRRKKRKSKRKKKKKDKKDRGDDQKQDNQKQQDRNQDQKEDKNQNSDENPNESQEDSIIAPAIGHLTGLSGMYQGANIDLSQNGNHVFTMGTTPEAMNALLTGSLSNLDQLSGSNCIIQYNKWNHQYTVMSHSNKDIILATKNGQIPLKNGETHTVGADTLLYIGDNNNSIKLV